MFVKVLMALCLGCASSVSSAQTPSDMAEKFLKSAASPQSDAAYDEIFADSGFAETKPQDLLTLKSQTKMAMSLYGEAIGLEKVREEDLSPSLKRLVYIQKFAKYPVAWEFYFYKPQGKWLINNLKFQDQVAPLVGAKQ